MQFSKACCIIPYKFRLPTPATSGIKLGGISIYIVKPVLDCKPVPVQIHDFAAARAHAAAHNQPVNHMDQDHM